MATDPFISRQDLSDYLGRDVTTDAGALMAVDAACQVCRTVAEQTFNRGTTTDIFDGTGTDALLLPELPVNSVGTVSVVTTTYPRTWTVAGTADWALNVQQGVLYATDTAGTSLFGCKWPAGRQNVSVTYVHGYDISTNGDMPRDVRRVALEIAARTLLQGVAISENMGDKAITYAAESTALMPTEKLILRKYRRAS